MRDDFLTIPDAPNYEINSELICRNKKTGKILKPRIPAKYTSKVYSLHHPDKPIIRSAATLRRQALSQFASLWVPVPSLDNLYETNRKGQLRHAKTKKILKPRKGAYHSTIGGKFFCTSSTQLKWEVFGILPNFSSRVHKPCFVSKDHCRFYFETQKEAIKFIADDTHYTPKYIEEFFLKRLTFIKGWYANYLTGTDTPQQKKAVSTP